MRPFGHQEILCYFCTFPMAALFFNSLKYNFYWNTMEGVARVHRKMHKKTSDYNLGNRKWTIAVHITHQYSFGRQENVGKEFSCATCCIFFRFRLIFNSLLFAAHFLALYECLRLWYCWTFHTDTQFGHQENVGKENITPYTRFRISVKKSQLHCL